MAIDIVHYVHLPMKTLWKSSSLCNKFLEGIPFPQYQASRNHGGCRGTSASRPCTWGVEYEGDGIIPNSTSQFCASKKTNDSLNWLFFFLRENIQETPMIFMGKSMVSGEEFPFFVNPLIVGTGRSCLHLWSPSLRSTSVVSDGKLPWSTMYPLLN